MPKLLATFTHHHDSEKSPWRCFVESEADAFEAALADEWQLVLKEPAADVLARAKEAGPGGVVVDVCDQGYEDDEDAYGDQIVVWDLVEEGKRNWGCGVGDRLEHTDKRDNVWICVEEWVPDPKKVAELEALSKEELVQRLLEVEATR